MQRQYLGAEEERKVAAVLVVEAVDELHALGNAEGAIEADVAILACAAHELHHVQGLRVVAHEHDLRHPWVKRILSHTKIRATTLSLVVDLIQASIVSSTWNFPDISGRKACSGRNAWGWKPGGKRPMASSKPSARCWHLSYTSTGSNSRKKKIFFFYDAVKRKFITVGNLLEGGDGHERSATTAARFGRGGALADRVGDDLFDGLALDKFAVHVLLHIRHAAEHDLVDCSRKGVGLDCTF